MQSNLKIVAIELTSACNLNCPYCRGNPHQRVDADELATQEITNLLEDLLKISRPMIVLSGGEPLLRQDLFQIASYAVKLGLRVVLATNGILITKKNIQAIKQAGIKRVSISIDGAEPSSHDTFRNEPGSFSLAIQGIKQLKEAAIEFQINSTINKHNLNQIEDIYNLAYSLGAKALHLFLLVPTDRANQWHNIQISPKECEQILLWLDKKTKTSNLELRATCAPHFFRITSTTEYSTRKGCLAGINFVFISSTGEVFPCGYLPISAGNIRKTRFTLIWSESEIFKTLRDINKLHGKCKVCKYKIICGGCRARAYAQTGDYLAEEPLCVYQPSD